MAPMALDEPLLQRGPKADLPPPTVYPAKEVRFEKFISPQHDGREKALAQPEGTATIVIDNGQQPAPISLPRARASATDHPVC